MNQITAQQSRDARRELGLSQADVTKALEFNRQYLSEFETGFSTRLTNAQLKKLRAFYEDKITEANNNGEDITLTFGEPESEKILPVTRLSTPQTAAPYRFIPFYLDVDQPVAIKTQGLIQDNDARIAVLLQQIATRDEGFFGSGEFDQETQDTLQEAFSLMAANYALWRSMSGWPALGLSTDNEEPQTIRDVVFSAFHEQLRDAGLIADDSNNQETETTEPVAV